MTIFKPMLACEADLGRLRYPLLASPKLDGIRAIVRDGLVYSRSNKPIPNAFVQARFKHLEYFDGELIVGEPTAFDVYRQALSHVMSHDKIDFDVRFYVFDHVEDPTLPYHKRFDRLPDVPYRAWGDGVQTHLQKEIHSLTHLLAFETEVLDRGYEGLILRDPNAPYKMGRSTMTEQYLVKLKRFTDAEYEVIGFEERMENTNVATTNELGRTHRSSHQAGKVGRGDLGALLLRGADCEFSCGTGFTDSERADIWNNQARYHGRLAKVKSFLIGVKEKPRHPVFLGWRNRSDT